MSQVAVGRRPEVNVFGNDYDTIDGTGTIFMSSLLLLEAYIDLFF